MAYKDMLFPKLIAIEALLSIRFSTDRVRVNSGFTYNNQNWERELAAFEVTQQAKRPVEWLPLVSFFRIAAGMANTWRLWNPWEPDATVATGKFEMIDSTHFQCVRRDTFGSYTYDRKVTKLATSIVVNGGSGVSSDAATGIVTVASGTPTSWTGRSYVHCQFATDEMKINSIDKNGAGEFLISWQSIPIEEVRE